MTRTCCLLWPSAFAPSCSFVCSRLCLLDVFDVARAYDVMWRFLSFHLQWKLLWLYEFYVVYDSLLWVIVQTWELALCCWWLMVALCYDLWLVHMMKNHTFEEIFSIDTPRHRQIRISLYFRVVLMVIQWLFNPFHATGFFQYPLKYPPEVFWCFQSVLKETKGMEWVN